MCSVASSPSTLCSTQERKSSNNGSDARRSSFTTSDTKENTEGGQQEQRESDCDSLSVCCRTCWSLQLKLQIYKDVPLYEVFVEQLGYLPDSHCARVRVTFSVQSCAQAPLAKPSSHMAHLIIGSLKNELMFYQQIEVSKLPVQKVMDVTAGTQIKACIVDDKLGNEKARTRGRELKRQSSITRSLFTHARVFCHYV